MTTSNDFKALGLAICEALSPATSSAPAQQITGISGSPYATSTVSSQQLPPPFRTKAMQ
jgi:hypothetical protein